LPRGRKLSHFPFFHSEDPLAKYNPPPPQSVSSVKISHVPAGHETAAGLGRKEKDKRERQEDKGRK
jgi:hypothetical protein